MTLVRAEIEIRIPLHPDDDCVAVTQAVQDEIGFTGAVVLSAEVIEE